MGALAPPAHPCGVLLVGVPRGGSRISQKGGGDGGLVHGNRHGMCLGGPILCMQLWGRGALETLF